MNFKLFLRVSCLLVLIGCSQPNQTSDNFIFNFIDHVNSAEIINAATIPLPNFVSVKLNSDESFFKNGNYYFKPISTGADNKGLLNGIVEVTMDFGSMANNFNSTISSSISAEQNKLPKSAVSTRKKNNLIKVKKSDFISVYGNWNFGNYFITNTISNAPIKTLFTQQNFRDRRYVVPLYINCQN